MGTDEHLRDQYVREAYRTGFTSGIKAVVTILEHELDREGYVPQTRLLHIKQHLPELATIVIDEEIERILASENG